MSVPLDRHNSERAPSVINPRLNDGTRSRFISPIRTEPYITLWFGASKEKQFVWCRRETAALLWCREQCVPVQSEAHRHARARPSILRSRQTPTGPSLSNAEAKHLDTTCFALKSQKQKRASRTHSWVSTTDRSGSSPRHPDEKSVSRG